MPNWCQNFATVTCPSKEIYDKLLDAIKQNIWFETFAPLGLDPEIYEDGWEYSKAIETWKTKWGAKDVQVLTQDDYEDVADCHDAVDEEIDNNIEDRKQKLTLELHFETAWSPPNGVYSIMNKKYGIEELLDHISVLLLSPTLFLFTDRSQNNPFQIDLDIIIYFFLLGPPL